MSSLYVVQKIVGKRVRDKKNVQYKVKWKNYDSSQNTWEPVKHLKNVQKMIKEFELRNKDKLPLPQAANLDKTNKLSTTIVKKNDLRKSARKSVCIRVNYELKKQKKQTDRIIKKAVMRNSRQQPTVISESEESQEEDAQQFNKQTKDHEQKLRKKNVQQTTTSELAGVKLNLDDIAAKIVEVFEDKTKSFKILGIEKQENAESDIYLVEDSNGNKLYKQRQFILKYLPRQLISYYQKELQLIN